MFGQIRNYVGWDGSGGNNGDLQIRNDFTVPTTYPINFFIGGAAPANQYMQLSGNPNIGYVGISPNFATYFTAPGAMLDVDGNINAGYPSQTDNSAYQIGYNNVL